MTLTDTTTEIDPTTGAPRTAHIVKQTATMSAAALVTQSRMEGTEMEALCGHRFVATRDPKQYPPCRACIDLYERAVDPGEGLPGDA